MFIDLKLIKVQKLLFVLISINAYKIQLNLQFLYRQICILIHKSVFEIRCKVLQYTNKKMH